MASITLLAHFPTPKLDITSHNILSNSAFFQHKRFHNRASHMTNSARKSQGFIQHTIPDICYICGTQHSYNGDLVQAYSHVFWNPLFPSTKTSAPECTRCNRLLELEKFHASLIASHNTVITDLEPTRSKPSLVALLASFLPVRRANAS